MEIDTFSERLKPAILSVSFFETSNSNETEY